MQLLQLSWYGLELTLFLGKQHLFQVDASVQPLELTEFHSYYLLKD